jgi:hypothetical protein
LIIENAPLPKCSNRASPYIINYEFICLIYALFHVHDGISGSTSIIGSNGFYSIS